MRKKELAAAHRAHVYYSGRVQGVGFRFTAERVALELGLVGWVRNLPDGRVEVVCEGSKENIELFLDRIQRSGLASYIQKTQCLWEEPTHEFKDFSIEFYS